MSNNRARSAQDQHSFNLIGTEFSSNGSESNKIAYQDRGVHDWYRFVLSFPPHLVREYLHRFGVDNKSSVLDPFCGTGTTLVECKKLGIPSVGVEANQIAYFASKTKTDWTPDPDKLLENSEFIAQEALDLLKKDGIEDNPVFPEWQSDKIDCESLRTLGDDTKKLLIKDSISPIPLHKTLILIELLEKYKDDKYYFHQKLALARALVDDISNLHFGPEVGVGPAKSDAPVIAAWMNRIRSIAQDLREFQRTDKAACRIYEADSRDIARILKPSSVDAVITSPPYPNEKDYTRTTRLESVLLGIINNKEELRKLKRSLIRSNTRGVYKEDADDQWVAQFPEIQRIADAIEARRIELGKTSGFERLYGRVTKLYFGGMARHLAELRTVLRPNAHLAYVVGDQASYLRVMIRTGQLLSEIAESLGYNVTGIDLFRTRLATATKEQLREEVVVLHWPGWKK